MLKHNDKLKVVEENGKEEVMGWCYQDTKEKKKEKKREKKGLISGAEILIVEKSHDVAPGPSRIHTWHCSLGFYLSSQHFLYMCVILVKEVWT